MSEDRATIIGAPSPIWLCLGDDFPAEEIQFSTLEEVTWCEDKQDSDDIEYVMKSNVDRLTASHAALLAALEELLGQRSNIEVLGEWSERDVNLSNQQRLRARVDATVEKARAAIKAAKGLG
jgi:hypothetical protein